MLSITKLQNLKAIHNSVFGRTKLGFVVINHKTTKFESNSQPSIKSTLWREGCYQSQNYKTWKQFTTYYKTICQGVLLLSITKLQNLKAIHNQRLVECYSGFVVINHKTIKFESNSQHCLSSYFSSACCYQSQNYKIWKQFTTTYTNNR